MECAKVLLAFGARVNVKNGYRKTPLDLVEGPWRLFSRHDSNHAIGSFPSHESTVFEFESAERPHFDVSVCTNMEYAPEKARNEFIHILKSVGAKRGRNVTKLRHASIELHPGLAERLSRFSVHWQHEQDLYAEKLMASILSSQEDIRHVLSSSDLEHGMSANDAMILGESMQKLKILRKAGSRILCLDGGGMRFMMQAEILTQIQAATGRKIFEMFDWIIGTSMGGVLALCMVYGK